VLYLSYFYKGDELPIRLSYFWVSLTSTTVIGSFLAYGLLHLRGVNGWAGWRYLFLIEGVLTLIVGILSFFYLPPSPTQTKGFLRGKGWFSEREEIIMVNRVLRDDPSKGDMNNRTAVGLRDLWRSLCDYDNWGLYLIGLVSYIPMAPPAGYLTLTLKNLGFGTFNSNLLTIPGSVLFMVNVSCREHVPCFFSFLASPSISFQHFLTSFSSTAPTRIYYWLTLANGSGPFHF
jgi:hypothetical protein